MESNGAVVNIGKGAQLLITGTMLGILLAACGGGGSSGGSSGGSGGSSNGVGNTPANNVSTSNTTAYNASLVALADTTRGIRLLLGLTYVSSMTGTPSPCPNHGSETYNSSALMMNLCQSQYPASDDYTVTANVTTSSSGSTVTDQFTSISMSVYDPTNTTSAVGAITSTSGGFTASNTPATSTAPDALTTLSNGSGSFAGWYASNTNAYTLSGINSQAYLSGGYTTTGGSNYSGSWLVVAHGSNTYSMHTPSDLAFPAGSQHPQSGSYGFDYTTTVGCSPVTVNFISISQFTIACGGYTATHSWTDVDVVAALAATN